MKCSGCSEIMRRGDIEAHELACDQVKKPCPRCDLLFTSKQTHDCFYEILQQIHRYQDDEESLIANQTELEAQLKSLAQETSR